LPSLYPIEYRIVPSDSCASMAKPMICSIDIVLPFLLGERPQRCALSVVKAAPEIHSDGLI
jgi:hypothetical protein